MSVNYFVAAVGVIGVILILLFEAETRLAASCLGSLARFLPFTIVAGAAAIFTSFLIGAGSSVGLALALAVSLTFLLIGYVGAAAGVRWLWPLYHVPSLAWVGVLGVDAGAWWRLVHS